MLILLTSVSGRLSEQWAIGSRALGYCDTMRGVGVKCIYRAKVGMLRGKKDHDNESTNRSLRGVLSLIPAPSSLNGYVQKLSERIRDIVDLGPSSQRHTWYPVNIGRVLG